MNNDVRTFNAFEMPEGVELGPTERIRLLPKSIVPSPDTDPSVAELDALVLRHPDLSSGLYFLLKLGLPFRTSQGDDLPAKGTNTFTVRHKLPEWLEVLLTALRAVDGVTDEVVSRPGVVAHKKEPL